VPACRAPNRRSRIPERVESIQDRSTEVSPLRSTTASQQDRAPSELAEVVLPGTRLAGRAEIPKCEVEPHELTANVPARPASPRTSDARELHRVRPQSPSERQFRLHKLAPHRLSVRCRSTAPRIVRSKDCSPPASWPSSQIITPPSFESRAYPVSHSYPLRPFSASTHSNSRM
jgi:hypothetical protein